MTQNHGGHGALGWGSFAANVYNRATGTGSVAMGFNNIAGNPEGNGNFGKDENNGGQAVFGRASRALGPVSFASGYRNTAAGTTSVAMGNFNYATGDSSVAIGKESYAEGAAQLLLVLKAMLLVEDQLHLAKKIFLGEPQTSLLDIKTLLEIQMEQLVVEEVP